jgi:hypothetical protein
MGVSGKGRQAKDISGVGSVRHVFSVGKVDGIQDYRRAHITTPAPPFPQGPPKLLPPLGPGNPKRGRKK